MTESLPTRWALTVPFTGVPLADHPELYRRAEALGYDDLWSGETPNGADGFTTLSIAIPVTQRMRLATGIVNPFTRGPAVLAQTAAAMQEASSGRFVLGLGASSNVIVERFNGLEFEKPLSKVRDAVQALRPVLSVPAEKGFGGLRLERPVTTPVPIVLAALRAKMLGLAGSVADGAFTNFLPLSGLPAVVDAHRAGEREGAVPRAPPSWCAASSSSRATPTRACSWPGRCSPPTGACPSTRRSSAGWAGRSSWTRWSRPTRPATASARWSSPPRS